MIVLTAVLSLLLVSIVVCRRSNSLMAALDVRNEKGQLFLVPTELPTSI